MTIRATIPVWLLAAFSVNGCADRPASREDTFLAHDSGNAPTSQSAAQSPSCVYDIDALFETDSGQNIHLADLRGKPRVFAMFFAGCEGSCALTLEELKRIEASLPAQRRSQVGFVMVTYDPAIDTAEKLSEYRASRALSSNWTLLRTDARNTEILAHKIGLTYTIQHPRRIVHSNGISVVDTSGKITNQQLGLHADLNVAIAALDAPPN